MKLPGSYKEKSIKVMQVTKAIYGLKQVLLKWKRSKDSSPVGCKNWFFVTEQICNYRYLCCWWISLRYLQIKAQWSSKEFKVWIWNDKY